MTQTQAAGATGSARKGIAYLFEGGAHEQKSVMYQLNYDKSAIIIQPTQRSNVHIWIGILATREVRFGANGTADNYHIVSLYHVLIQ